MNKIKNNIFREKINESASSGQSSTERKLEFYIIFLMVKSKAIFLQNCQEVRKLRYIINSLIMHTPYFIATKIPVGSTWRVNLE